tara:strand:+ start:74 stop:991 length:918 start_codon:yes stop_codon:yes gene_type:complete
VLYFREGWNYLLELYFWILIGAILLVSITILLARPSPKNNTNQYDYENLGGSLEETTGGNPIDKNSEKSNTKDNEVELEEGELPPEVIEKLERRKWALGFVIFGSTFVMMGAILLFLSEFEFTTFLGSCMMYVGIIALIKGASFELQKDKKYNELSSIVFFLLIFFINFILLTELLGVFGTYAWAVATPDRKAGDLLLIYFLPYVIWKLVPTFGAADNLKTNRSFLLETKTVLFLTIFNYIILIVTSAEYIFWPILNQYAGPGFQVSLYLLFFTITVRMILDIATSTPKEEDGPNFRQWLARRKK